MLLLRVSISDRNSTLALSLQMLNYLSKFILLRRSHSYRFLYYFILVQAEDYSSQLPSKDSWREALRLRHIESFLERLIYFDIVHPYAWQLSRGCLGQNAAFFVYLAQSSKSWQSEVMEAQSLSILSFSKVFYLLSFCRAAASSSLHLTNYSLSF